MLGLRVSTSLMFVSKAESTNMAASGLDLGVGVNHVLGKALVQSPEAKQQAKLVSTYDQKAAVAHWDCGYDQGLGTLQECAVHKLRERERRRAALLPRSAAPPAKAARNWRAQRREPPCVRGRTSLSGKGVRCRIAVARAACVADTSGSGVHKGAQRALSVE